MSSKILLLSLVVISLAAVGCSRCVNCGSCPAGVQLESEEFCEDEFASAADYEQAVDLAEGFGCTCVEQ